MAAMKWFSISGKFNTSARSAVGLACCWAVLLGCSTQSGVGRSSGPIGELHMFGVPVALEMNGLPGPDGIGVRVYASARGMARGLPIRQGTLDILMFEGAVDAGLIRTLPAQQVWSFSPEQLQELSAVTSLGMGYQLGLRWEKTPPREPVVTVVARYRSLDGKIVYSSADTIPISPK